MSKPIDRESYRRGFHVGAGALAAAWLESFDGEPTAEMVAVWETLERLRFGLQPEPEEESWANRFSAT